MLSGVLNSPRAVEANIEIMRAFIRIRALLGGQKDLALRLADLERTLGRHDYQIKEIFDAIRRVMKEPDKAPPKKIGFT